MRRGHFRRTFRPLPPACTWANCSRYQRCCHGPKHAPRVVVISPRIRNRCARALPLTMTAAPCARCRDAACANSNGNKVVFGIERM